jgi:hypothetical protein
MRLARALLASWLALGCSSDEAPAQPGEGEGGTAADPTCDDRGQPLVPGLSLQGAEDVEVQLQSLEPSQPVVGDNNWSVSVTRAGAVLEGAALEVSPWMPDHQHASTKTVLVVETDPGTYRLSPVYLGMLGYWEIGIDIELDDELLAHVSFDTCLSRQ